MPDTIFYTILRSRGKTESSIFIYFQSQSDPFKAIDDIGVVGPCSVDSLDGGATDVPILWPMEIKNYITILDRPTVPKRLEKNPPSNESTEHGLI